jgi:ribonuclease PH
MAPKKLNKDQRLRMRVFNLINVECSIDIILRFNNDYSKERTRYLQGLLINYVESLLFTEEYPRCQILIVINLISFSNENELLASLFNGIMFALSSSGIDLKVFGIDVFI